jgi:hypothetical protein
LTRITNTDQVLLLLQSHLQRAQRAERKTAGAVSKSNVPQTPIERLQNLVRQDELPETEIGRAIVRGLLAHEFGAAVANDAKFNALVDEVLGAIRRDEATSRLLERAIQQLTGR